MDVLTQNLTAAHSLAQFLTCVTEECPEKVLPLVSCILQFLEWEVFIKTDIRLSKTMYKYAYK